MHRAKLLLALPFLTLSPLTHAADNTMLVLDGSGSMWGQIQGKTKIEIARDALKNLIKDWPADKQVGLVAYGHRKKGDCNDIETLLPLGTLDKAKMTSTVDGINPKGKTPLSAAVKHAAEALKYTEDKATVILISDGIETCDMNPCELGTALEKSGVDFTAHVIGFDVQTDQQTGLRCLAKNTGGVFIAANNAEELNEALKQATDEAEAEPPVLPEASLAAADEAPKASLLSVTPNADKAGFRGFINLYPQGEEGYVASVQVGKTYAPVNLQLPNQVGAYTLKWESMHQQVLAEKALQIVEAEIAINAPETAERASMLPLTLQAPLLGGNVYIYPKGETEYVSSVRVPDGVNQVELRLPAQTGDYVLKWESVNQELLAEKALQIVEAVVAIKAPTSAKRATLPALQVQGPVLDGYLYIYPKDSADYLTYARVKDTGDVELRLPVKTGDYVLKWYNAGEELLAEQAIVVEDAPIALKTVASAPKGSDVTVQFEAPEDLGAYVYTYPKGSDEYSDEYRVGDHFSDGLVMTLPEQAGEYVLKWQTMEGEVYAEIGISITE